MNATAAQETAPVPELTVRQLGLADYEPVWRNMQRFTDSRTAGTADEFWCVQHSPVFTQGQAGRAEHLLAPGQTPVVEVDRGGQVTWHGPGQIVLYPLLDLHRLGLGVRELVTRIEDTIIQVLEGYGVVGARREGAPGVYVGDAKIAALGLRVRKGRSFHGLAFNIDNDLEPFSRINPCGYQGLAVTRLADLAEVTLPQVQGDLVASLAANLGYNDGFRRAEGLPVART